MVNVSIMVVYNNLCNINYLISPQIEGIGWNFKFTFLTNLPLGHFCLIGLICIMNALHVVGKKTMAYIGFEIKFINCKYKNKDLLNSLCQIMYFLFISQL